MIAYLRFAKVLLFYLEEVLGQRLFITSMQNSCLSFTFNCRPFLNSLFVPTLPFHSSLLLTLCPQSLLSQLSQVQSINQLINSLLSIQYSIEEEDKGVGR